MEINLTEIYKGLAEWRAERGITAESQKAGYLVNVMEEFGELAQALRDYEKFSATDYPYPTDKQEAEHGIIDALCDISVFTINAGADIPRENKISVIEKNIFQTYRTYETLLNACGGYSIGFNAYAFNGVLRTCAVLCYKLGFNFEIAMLETIKEISSRTGAYNENAKKWVKDTSDEARAKWYKADYELARIEKMNPTQIMAFNEISQWIKYKGFTQEDLAQILCVVNKECLKARDITISELISKGTGK